MALPEHHSDESGEFSTWSAAGEEFVLLDAVQPPARIAMARERMLLSRLYLGLIRSLNDDYGADFVRQNDSATFRTIGIYLFLRTAMCSPVRASTVAQVLKLPRATVLRRLEEMIKRATWSASATPTASPTRSISPTCREN